MSSETRSASTGKKSSDSRVEPEEKTDGGDGDEKKESLTSREQRNLETRERAARTRRARRWKQEGIKRREELALMRLEDTRSLYCAEVSNRRTKLLELVAMRAKQKSMNEELRQQAIDASQKVSGRQMEKGWYTGSVIYGASPNIIRVIGAEQAGNDAHQDAIMTMAVDPTERFVFTGARDNLIKLWSLETGHLLATYNGHKGAVTKLRMHSVELPRSRQIYGKGNDNTNNAIAQQEEKLLRDKRRALPSTRVPHTLLSASQDFSIRKWDPSLRGWVTFNQAKEIVKEAHRQIIHSMAISPNGEHFATASADGTVVLWNMRRSLRIFTFQGHRDAVTAVTFSRDGDGQFLVSSSGATDATIKMWDTYVYERLPRKPEPKEYVPVHRGVYKGMAVFAGGAFTVHHGTPTQMVIPTQHDNNSGEEKESKIKNSDISEKDIAEDSAVESDEDNDTKGDADEVKRSQSWRKKMRGRLPPTDEEIEAQRREEEERATALAMADEAARRRTRWSRMFSRDKNKVKSANAPRSALPPRFEDRDPVAARGGLVRTFAVRREGTAWSGHTGWVNHVCFSNKGRRIASASCDQTIRLWNPWTGNVRAVLRGHTDWVMHCVFSRDDKTLVSASADRSVRMWDIASRAPLHILRGHRDVVNNCMVLSTGRILSCGADNKLVYWQVSPLPPLAPSLVEVTEVSTHHWDVRWAVPSGMGRPLTSYVLQIRGGYRVGQGDVQKGLTETPEDFVEKFEWGYDQEVSVRDHMRMESREDYGIDLIPGGLYQMRVAAKSSAGLGEFSEPCRLVRLHATKPDKILRPQVEAITPTDISFSWKQPRNMGARILHYIVQIQGGGITFQNCHLIVVTSEDARKGAGRVLRTMKKQQKSELEALNGNDDMTDTEKRRLGVRKALLKRQMKKKRAALRETQKHAHVGEGGMVATTMARLKPGYTYQFRVRAINRVGEGPWSRPTYSTQTASIEPEKPIPVRVHGNKQRQLEVSWKAPYDNGAQISGYVLRYVVSPPKEELEEKPKSEESKKEEVITGGAKEEKESDDSSEEDHEIEDHEEQKEATKSISIEEKLRALKWTYKKLRPTQPWTTKIGFLEPGTAYLFQLQAENDKGQSAWSNFTRSATTATPPEAPGKLLAVGIGPSNMTLHWRIPYGNGAPVRSYIIKRRARGMGEFGQEVMKIGAMCRIAPPNVDAFDRPYGKALIDDDKWLGTEIDGLLANTVYEFTISGVNRYGVGKASYPSDEAPTKPPELPRQMAPPVLDNESPESIDIEWKPPVWDGGAPITHYKLRRDVNGTNVWKGERKVLAGEGDSESELPTKITLTGIRDGISMGKKYRYQVSAVTDAGESPWSEPSNVLKCPTKMEFIVISHERKKKAKEARAAATIAKQHGKK